MGALLTRRQVAEIAGVSEKTVARTLEPAEHGPVGRNGKPVPLYDLAVMPAGWQKQWARANKVVAIAPAAVPAQLSENSGQLALALTTPTGPNLSVEDRAEADRRFEIIEPLIDREQYHLLWIQYPAASQMMDYLARAHSKPERQISARTIYRWWSLWKREGLPGLVRRDRSDRGGSRVMNDAAKALLVKLMLPQKGMYGALRVREGWRAYEEERVWREAHITRPMGEFEQDKYSQWLDMEGRLLPAARLPKISYETFRVWFNKIPEMVRVMAREGPDAYRTYEEIISHRDYASMLPMDWVVMDHRVLDIFCMVRDGRAWKLVRPWGTFAMDMRTRKWLAWAFVEQPSSDSIATVLKKVFVEYGLPAELYWDNGKDFRCEWLEGGRRRERKGERVADLDATWRGVLGTLDIRVRHAIPYRARSKNIEPNFNRVSGIDRQLPWWCGNKPGARPESFADLVKQHERWVAGEGDGPVFPTIEEVAALYGAALRDLNEREMSPKTEGMRTVGPTGYVMMSPNQAWDKLIGKVERRSVPADVLHLCFAKRVDLTVRNGELSMTRAGKAYYYRLLDNSQRLQLYNGKVVQLAYDPLDLGEGAIYYDDHFLGLVGCVELRRMGEEAFRQDERDRRAGRRETNRAIAALSGAAPAADLATRLARRAEVLPARMEVPRVEVPRELPAPVVEAAAAVREGRGFDFEAVAAEVVSAAKPAEPNEDDEFVFFGD